MTWSIERDHATNGTTKIDVVDGGDLHITIGLAGWIVIPREVIAGLTSAIARREADAVRRVNEALRHIEERLALMAQNHSRLLDRGESRAAAAELAIMEELRRVRRMLRSVHATASQQDGHPQGNRG